MGKQSLRLNRRSAVRGRGTDSDRVRRINRPVPTSLSRNPQATTVVLRSDGEGEGPACQRSHHLDCDSRTATVRQFGRLPRELDELTAVAVRILADRGLSNLSDLPQGRMPGVL